MVQKRKQTFANIARNIRRQADRRIAQLNKIAQNAKNKFVAQGANQRIAQIEQAKRETYYRRTEDGVTRQTTEEERRAGLQKLAQGLSSTRYASVRGRRNLSSTEAQLNAATADAPSVYTKAETKIFYKATQKAWQRPGVSVKERNQAILEYYGYENLSELVSDILTMNSKAVEASQLFYSEELTPEQREAADEEQDIKEAAQYPMYLRDVIPMAEPSGLSELEKAE